MPPQAPPIAVDPDQTRDLRPLALDSNGRLRILPAEFWQSTTVHERALFGGRTGIYSFPTVELVARLRELIDGRSAIEIGSGNGVLAEMLGIPATDNMQQRMPYYRVWYQSQGLQPVPYGPNVIEMHASRAVRHYRPQVVLGCWVTHKYDKHQPERGGNEIGIDWPDILRACETCIFVGNERVHHEAGIWDRPHEIEYPAWLYSRAHSGGRDFIATFRGLSTLTSQPRRTRLPPLDGPRR